MRIGDGEVVTHSDESEPGAARIQPSVAEHLIRSRVHELGRPDDQVDKAISIIICPRNHLRGRHAATRPFSSVKGCIRAEGYDTVDQGEDAAALVVIQLVGPRSLPYSQIRAPIVIIIGPCKGSGPVVLIRAKRDAGDYREGPIPIVAICSCVAHAPVSQRREGLGPKARALTKLIQVVVVPDGEIDVT